MFNQFFLVLLAFVLESLPANFCQASNFRRYYFSRSLLAISFARPQVLGGAIFLESLPAIFCKASSFKRQYVYRKPAGSFLTCLGLQEILRMSECNFSVLSDVATV